MKNIITHQARAFRVEVRDMETGAEFFDVVVLDKSQLQAAQMVGESSKELIRRLYAKRGLKVLSIGKPVKKEFTINLTELFMRSCPDWDESMEVNA